MNWPQPQPPPPLEPFDPRAVIARQGRFIYHIDIQDGLTGLSSPWLAIGRGHAERRARRKLAWYKRKFGPPRGQWTIGST